MILENITALKDNHLKVIISILVLSDPNSARYGPLVLLSSLDLY